MNRIASIIYFIFLLLNMKVAAQEGSSSGQHPVSVQLPAIALLDIEPAGGNLELTFDQPTEAGSPLVTGANTIDNSLWLNYTSAVTQAGPSRSITVQIEAGTIPPGTILKLETAAYSGSGAGTLGVPSGILTLSTSPQACLSGIRGAYTGDGTGNGHQLTYSLEISNYSQLEAAISASLTISYTITDN